MRQGAVDATEAIATRLLSNAAAWEANALTFSTIPTAAAAAAGVQPIVEEEVLEESAEVDIRWRDFNKRQRLVRTGFLLVFY